jgi:hypothetical protein
MQKEAPKPATEAAKPVAAARKPKIPVAEKTPRQKRTADKKPAEATPTPTADEDKRFGFFL